MPNCKALLFSGLIAAGVAHAQFAGLATTADGSSVYFATALRQKNTNQANWGKLFQADSAGLRLRESREYQVPDPPPEGVATGAGLAHPTNAYQLQFASISSDARVFAVTGRRDCVSGGSYCSKMENYFTTITVDGKSTDYPGNLQLSAGGQWAFGGSSHPSHDDFPYYAYLVDLKTGTQTTVSANIGSEVRMTTSGRPVANNGTAVFAMDRDVVILSGGKMLRITAPDFRGAAGAVIDAAGRTVVYAVCPFAPSNGPCAVAGPRSLWIADAVSGDAHQLVGEGDAPSISDDGATVLYLSNRSGTPQLRLIRTDGSDDRELTHDSAGIARAVLSGDGSAAYAVTLGGRLIQIKTSSGDVQVVVPRTPVLGSLAFGGIAPGKISSLTGLGLADSTETAGPPLPDSLAGVSVTIQGKPARILIVGPTTITIVAPPDLVPSANDTQRFPVVVRLESDSPFERPADPDVYVWQYYPEILYVPGYSTPSLLSAHQDWSGLVTPDSPATPGEILHSYAVGLGPTIPAVPYGEAAPAQEPFARVQSGFSCMGNRAFPVEILFQGLAPNFAGFYQVDWRVPVEVPDGSLLLLCTAPGLTGVVGGTVPVRRAQ